MAQITAFICTVLRMQCLCTYSSESLHHNYEDPMSYEGVLLFLSVFYMVLVIGLCTGKQKPLVIF